MQKTQKILKIKSTTFYETNGDFVKNHRMGRNSYAGDYFAVADIETRIGNFCSIADNVTLGTTFHPTDRLSTHPFTYFEPMRLTKNAPLIPFSYHTPVIIGNDVWIGKHVTIMDGIKIGDGAIIGTNAVVTKDVPPYAIVVGIPARILRYRFDEKTICDLLQLKWWDLKDEDIAKQLNITEKSLNPLIYIQILKMVYFYVKIKKVFCLKNKEKYRQIGMQINERIKIERMKILKM